MPAEVKLFDDWDAVARDAAGALDRAAQPCLFDRLAWYRLVAEHCPPPGRPLAARAQDGRDQAWLFLSVEGARAQAMASWYSLRFGAAMTPDTSDSLLVDLVKSLTTQPIATLDLYPIAKGDPLASALRRAGWIVSEAPAYTSWSIRTEGMDFDSYWAARPGRLRNTAKRKTKSAGLEIVLSTRFDEAEWEAYEQVYAASWKPEEGSPAFLRALAEQEGAAGTLRLGIARKDGRPVAAQLWLVENGVATIHKLAYAEDAKSLSPGTILSVAMFRHALDVDKVRLIDFGTGDDAYKAEWMEESAPLYRVTAYNPATIAGLYGAARAFASRLVHGRRSV